MDIILSPNRIFIACGYTDMRKSIDGLAALVRPMLDQDPFSGQVFVFVGRRRDKVKCLLWDRTGFWCLYKRIERGTLPAPQAIAREGITMGELGAWLEGIDMSRARTLESVRARLVG